MSDEDHHAGLAHLFREPGSEVAGAAGHVERALARDAGWSATA